VSIKDIRKLNFEKILHLPDIFLYIRFKYLFNKTIQMKTSSLLLLIVFIAFSTTVNAQIPNGDFEKWTLGTDYDMPTGWDNLNLLTLPKKVFTCQRGVETSPANVFIRLVSDSVEGIGVAPGIAVCGTLDKTTFRPKSGFAYSQRPSALSGRRQFMAQGDDPGFIAVYFTKWNTTTKKRDVIGSGVDTLAGMAMGWSSFSIPITFSNPAAPDSCIIFLSSSGPTPIQYSYLYVDDLAFDTGAGIFENARTTADFKSFPNPVADVLQLDLHKLSDVQSIQIVNLQGQVMHSQIGNQLMPAIDVSNLARGIYFIQVKTKNNVLTQKFDKL
jgi:hypothetical protein